MLVSSRPENRLKRTYAEEIQPVQLLAVVVHADALRLQVRIFIDEHWVQDV